LREIAQRLIEEILQALRNNDRIGVIRQNSDGSLEISTLFLEPVKKSLRGRLRSRRK
jgi:hypothetical protein